MGLIRHLAPVPALKRITRERPLEPLNTYGKEDFIAYINACLTARVTKPMIAADTGKSSAWAVRAETG